MIRIICLYAGQAKELGIAVKEAGFEDVLVTTADGCQGHEADLVIVTTTKAGLKDEASGKFWNDERRVNVALSRAKYGMLIIGDLKMLWSAGGVWRRFLDKALTYTKAVGPDYVEAMVHTRSRYADGKLIGPDGPVLAKNFYDEWGPDGTNPSHSQAVARSGPQRGERRPSGLCHYCRRPGHFIQDCEVRLARNGGRGGGGFRDGGRWGALGARVVRNGGGQKRDLPAHRRGK